MRWIVDNMEGVLS